MNPLLLKEDARVVGIKQALRLVLRGEAKEAFIAKDVDEAYVKEILLACEKAGVSIQWIATKAELGRLCGIAVGASAVALKKLENEPFSPEGCRG